MIFVNKHGIMVPSAKLDGMSMLEIEEQDIHVHSS